MNIKCLLVIVALLTNNFSKSQTFTGTNLRGRVVTMNNQLQVPLISAKIDLYFFDNAKPQGSQWVLVASTLTDAYGFYFFKNIAPNNYTVWVNKTKSYNIQVTTIDQKSYTYEDLPQFVF